MLLDSFKHNSYTDSRSREACSWFWIPHGVHWNRNIFGTSTCRYVNELLSIKSRHLLENQFNIRYLLDIFFPFVVKRSIYITSQIWLDLYQCLHFKRLIGN